MKTKKGYSIQYRPRGGIKTRQRVPAKGLSRSQALTEIARLKCEGGNIKGFLFDTMQAINNTDPDPALFKTQESNTLMLGVFGFNRSCSFGPLCRVVQSNSKSLVKRSGNTASELA
jgi:hypothetical protein